MAHSPVSSKCKAFISNIDGQHHTLMKRSQSSKAGMKKARRPSNNADNTTLLEPRTARAAAAGRSLLDRVVDSSSSSSSLSSFFDPDRPIRPSQEMISVPSKSSTNIPSTLNVRLHIFACVIKIYAISQTSYKFSSLFFFLFST